jgi:glycosyltransferase involved in cell wall biosynthesis
MSRDTLVLLTTYNRPRMVAAAIASVLAQDCDRWRLLVLDDGCNPEARAAIRDAQGLTAWDSEQHVAGGVAVSTDRVTWWMGPDRTMAERKATIPYSRTINIGLNHLRRDERYLTYLCDDDVLHPHSVRLRAEYLDAHPQEHVVYGRLRSVQFGADGSRNQWQNSGPPQPLTADFPLPTGPRAALNGGASFRALYDDGVDPDTHASWVEEGFWRPGLMRYGVDGRCDHNQVMHRVNCLGACLVWVEYGRVHGPNNVEYWGEDNRHGVGDAAFFEMLARAHYFVGVDCWAVSKAYHGLSDGISSAEVRE